MFTFADTFAGIGGFRFAAEAHGGQHAWSCEIDKFARRTYATFHGEEPTDGDIRAVDVPALPDFNLLCGGFPCQSFSLAAINILSHLGRPGGLDDPSRGQLFLDLANILAVKRPRAFLFENVLNLIAHDGGKTFRTITDVLSSLDYRFAWKVINATGWVPQKRRRVFIVGFRNDLGISEADIASHVLDLSPPEGPSLADILEPNPDPKFTLHDKTWAFLNAHGEKHKARGNGFGYCLIEPPFEGKITRALAASYYFSSPRDILIAQEGKNPRKLTILESLRLMGFPKSCERWFDGTEELPVSVRQAGKQFGNSVVVPLVTNILEGIAGILE